MLSVTSKRIEHALAVFDQGGVSAAARELNVSQPSLSVSISQLESELGRSLFFRRKGHSIAATPFGVTFLKEARVLIRQTRLLMQGTGSEGQVSGNISFGCFEDLAPFYLAGIVTKMDQAFPAVTVQYHVSGFENLTRELARGTIDLALTFDLGLGDQIERSLVSTVRPYVLVAKPHRLARRKTISLQELASEPLILSDQSLSWQHILDLFKTVGIDPIVRFKASSFELQRSFVSNGLGVAVCYTRSATLQSYDGKALHRLEISNALPDQAILLAHITHAPPIAAVGRMIELVKSVINF